MLGAGIEMNTNRTLEQNLSVAAGQHHSKLWSKIGAPPAPYVLEVPITQRWMHCIILPVMASGDLKLTSPANGIVTAWAALALVCGGTKVWARPPPADSDHKPCCELVQGSTTDSRSKNVGTLTVL